VPGVRNVAGRAGETRSGAVEVIERHVVTVEERIGALRELVASHVDIMQRGCDTTCPRAQTGDVARIRVSTVVDASRAVVWQALEDIGRHVVWMDDAEAIRFTSPQQHGVGTTYECDTRIGPVRLVDRMEIVEWRPRRSMGVRHRGLVAGEGRFTLRRARGGRTRFTWHEELRFPWWVGGPLAAAAATPVLRRVWRRNLRNLSRYVSGFSAR
jgi:hypothetical protein